MITRASKMARLGGSKVHSCIREMSRPRWMRARWRLALALVAGSLGTVAAEPSAGGHGEEEHSAAAAAVSPLIAPGWGELAFEVPSPGSYALPPLGTAANGRVLRSDGAATTLHDLFGDRVVVLSFIYASCSDVNGCPLATSVLQRLKSRVQQAPELAGQLRLVSLSFDPERDTPDAMRRYGEHFSGAELLDWAFLTTASRTDLDPILDAYGQGVNEELDAEGRPTARLAHLLRVFLIDSERRIRNVYTTSFLHPDSLIADVKTLLLESDTAVGRAGHASVSEASPGAGPESGGALSSAGPVPGSTFLGSGDRRQGYDGVDYRTRSTALAARRGRPADLLARASRPVLGLPPLTVPSDNPLTREKIQLGRKLFYDRRLSHNGTFSCAMCHLPEQGFTSNELGTAVGIEGRTVRRNAPTLYNVAFSQRLFHDARETRLEHQVWGPLLAHNEMGNPSIGVVVEKLRNLADYAGRFEHAFPVRGLSMETIGMALASYQRSLVSGNSPFDRWRFGGDESSLSESAVRGFRLFEGKGRCSSCHTVGSESALFHDGKLHNTGVGFAASMGQVDDSQRVQVAPGRYLEVDRALVAAVSEPRPSDLGRYEITQDPADRWKYRTPGLRNVALTAPYMHDGSLATLREVVEFYSRGGVPNPVLDPLLRPLDLTPREIDDLVALLQSLTAGDVEELVSDAFAAPIGDVGGRADETDALDLSHVDRR